jgi:hypothetical protein
MNQFLVEGRQSGREIIGASDKQEQSLCRPSPAIFPVAAIGAIPIGA